MKEVAIAAKPRPALGKGPARQARMAGDIPAVVYGPDVTATPVTVSDREFHAAMRHASGTTVFNIELDGKKNLVVLRDIQRDPVTSRVVHLDFYAISETRPLTIAVPLKFVGTSRGVKDEGGIMQVTMHEIEVSCLPKDIPQEVQVDISALGIGESIHVSELNIPNVEILAEERRTVVVISAPTVMKATGTEEEGAEEGEEGAEEGAEAAAEGEEAKGAKEGKEAKGAKEGKEAREKKE